MTIKFYCFFSHDFYACDNEAFVFCPCVLCTEPPCKSSFQFIHKVVVKSLCAVLPLHIFPLANAPSVHENTGIGGRWIVRQIIQLTFHVFAG